MKAISITTREFPTPYKMAMYLFAVTAFSLLNWAVLRANDNSMDDATMLQSRLTEALEPAADPQYEIEDWLLTFSEDLLHEDFQAAKSLENRLAMALEPIAEAEPALEEWLLTFSDKMVEKNTASMTELENRLNEALKPMADPEPELEDWMFKISDVLLQGDC